jgi:hypothetical protein
VTPPPGEGVDTVMGIKPKVAISVSLMVAVSWLLETKLVGRGDPFQSTVDPATKLEPLTVREKPVPPCCTSIGLRSPIPGTGLGLIVNVPIADVPPPGGGLKTTTVAVPTAVMSEVVIAACKWFVETKVVVRGEPFQRACEEIVKFAPKRSIRRGGPLTNPEFGIKEFRTGSGVPATVKEGPAEIPVPMPGVTTVILICPAVTTSVAVMAACNWALEINVVVRGLPFHATVEVLRKLEPFTVSVKLALPAGTEFGVMVDTCGTGVGVGVATGVGVGAGVDLPPPPHPSENKKQITRRSRTLFK